MTREALINLTRMRVDAGWTDERIIKAEKGTGLSEAALRDIIAEARKPAEASTENVNEPEPVTVEHMAHFIAQAEKSVTTSRQQPTLLQIQETAIRYAQHYGASSEEALLLFYQVQQARADGRPIVPEQRPEVTEAVQIADEQAQEKQQARSKTERELWKGLKASEETRPELAKRLGLTPAEAAEMENRLTHQEIAEAAGVPVNQCFVPSRYYKTARHYAPPL